MKKISALFLAATMLLAATSSAIAIDFKAKGEWVMSFGYGKYGNFAEKADGHKTYGWGFGQDDFEANQRLRLQLDAVASESLSGTVYFQMGETTWGQASSGGALGADGKIVELKGAWIDWMPPDSDLKVRMGISEIALPSFTLGSNPVMDDDVAGITASYQINDNVGITAIWMRPYNDNFTGTAHGDNYAPASFMDNMDLGALVVPLTFDGIQITPWGMYGAIGPNTFRDGQNYIGNNGDAMGAAGIGYAMEGLFPVAGARSKDFRSKNDKKISQYGNAWWAGVTGQITLWDPFSFAWDFTYGQVAWDDNGSLNRQGWLATAEVQYKLDWALLALHGWYGSGDDNDPSNGSERLPTFGADNDNNFSYFAFNGTPYIARCSVIGNGMGGTWGVGIRVDDVSFIEDLTHTLRINLIGGTNSPSMAKKMSLAGLWANGDALSNWDGPDPTGVGFSGMYLTTKDYAMEFGLLNNYQMYENFSIVLEADYVAMWLDTSKSVWGARERLGMSVPSTADAWNINATFVYSF